MEKKSKKEGTRVCIHMADSMQYRRNWHSGVKQLYSKKKKKKAHARSIWNMEVCQELYDLSVLTGFPSGAVVKNLPANVGDTGSIHGQEDPTCGKQLHPCSELGSRNCWARGHDCWSPCAWGLCSTREATPMRSLCTTRVAPAPLNETSPGSSEDSAQQKFND